MDTKKSKSSLSFLKRNPFKYDSSSSDEEDEGGEKKRSKENPSATGAIDDFARELAKKSGSAAPSHLSEPFFFSGAGDTRFSEGAEFLRPTQSLDEIRANYETVRPVLATIMKKKLRAKAKRQEKKASFGAGGRRKRGFNAAAGGRMKGKRKA